MALELWLLKVQSAVSSTFHFTRWATTSAASDGGGGHPAHGARLGILAFEVASLMSKLLQLWYHLSDSQLSHLRHELLAVHGLCKIVSDDHSFLLGLASAELAESIRLAGESISLLAGRCADPGLRRFGPSFKEFADSGHDPHRWVISWKEMEAKARKIDRHLSTTAVLHKEMEQLWEGEQALKKLVQCSGGHGPSRVKVATISNLQQKLSWKKQEVKRLKKISLWEFSFDIATAQLARLSFTVLSRLKHVFGDAGVSPASNLLSSSFPCIHFVSSAVHPSSCGSQPLGSPGEFTSGPLIQSQTQQDLGFFDANSALLRPPPSTLGAASLALHYATIIFQIEKLIWSPQLIGSDARDELYSMLPESLRTLLRSRLREVGRRSASDALLADEWRTALSRILDWLAPLAHHTLQWQAEQSFGQRQSASARPKSPVLLPQTLFFADREKTEGTIVELLVGLTYMWKFAMEARRAPPAAAMADYWVDAQQEM
ncbi:unnamed protein product [Spirodela intermedia]|uniref:Uncharacterized protein n=1 Tax=Spirodela intermedia TaxID=51605 RepID=A0A7I8IF11_SPIIN|nr:unnamed protein product [Spirodela intermedia]CAA6656269.1 unnamed protein product [Spirodela intermedia]